MKIPLFWRIVQWILIVLAAPVFLIFAIYGLLHREITSEEVEEVTKEAWRRGPPKLPELTKRKGRNG